jgi:hypothetical protein
MLFNDLASLGVAISFKRADGTVEFFRDQPGDNMGPDPFFGGAPSTFWSGIVFWQTELIGNRHERRKFAATQSKESDALVRAMSVPALMPTRKF